MGSTLTTCIFLLAFLLAAPALGAKLKLVILHHRHGARNAFKTFGPAPPELGQLTAVGFRQLYLLGVELRKRYVEQEATKLLPKRYDPTLVYARSTQINRTLLSAQAFWSGFYPAGTGPNFTAGYPYKRAVPPIKNDYNVTELGNFSLPMGIQPVPIHSTALSKDWVLQAYDHAACPNMGKITNNEENQKVTKEMTALFQPVFAEVAKAFPKLKFNDTIPISTMSSIADYMYSNYMSNLTPEIPVGGDLWNKLFAIKNITILQYYYQTRFEMDVFTTKLYEDMLYRLDAAINNKSTNRLIEFSSHDLTLNLILVSLKITSWECLLEKFKSEKLAPNATCPYTTEVAANLLFELWEEDDKKYSIKFLYNGVPYPINGKDAMPYDEFTALLKSTIKSDFFDHCLGKEPAVESPMATWQIFVVAAQGLAVVVLGWLFIRKRLEVSQAMASSKAPLAAYE